MHTRRFPWQEARKFPVMHTRRFPWQEARKFPVMRTRRFPWQEARKFPVMRTRRFPWQEARKFPVMRTRRFPWQEARKFPVMRTRATRHASRFPWQETTLSMITHMRRFCMRWQSNNFGRKRSFASNMRPRWMKLHTLTLIGMLVHLERTVHASILRRFSNKLSRWLLNKLNKLAGPNKPN
jgi:hypothetical protein